MEPVTHVLTGACLARTGFHRRTAYATAAMALAAEFPDIDTLWSLRGPVAGFEHHRGLTHTFLGIPFEAALLLLGFMLFHRLRTRTKVTRQPGTNRRGEPAPVRWGVLYSLLLLALGSHLLLDYTNNYGIRPFFPFHDSWYAASLVFIFDPLLFLFLLAGLVLPSLFGLIGGEIGAKRERYRGQGWARAALLGVLLLWTLRWVEHRDALALAQGQTLRAPATDTPASSPDGDDTPAGTLQPPSPDRPLLFPQRSLASPDPLSPFRWYTVTDFGPAYSLGVADTRSATLVPDTILAKPPSTAFLAAAEASRLGRDYLDWSPMPLVRLSDDPPPDLDSASGALPPIAGERLVTFTDLRFLGNTPWLGRGGQVPLSGAVVLGPKGEILAQGMGGRFRP